MLISIPCVLMALLAAPEIKPTLIALRAMRAEVAALPTEWFVRHDRGFEIAASLHSPLLAHETERARANFGGRSWPRDPVTPSCSRGDE